VKVIFGLSLSSFSNKLLLMQIYLNPDVLSQWNFGLFSFKNSFNKTKISEIFEFFDFKK